MSGDVIINPTLDQFKKNTDNMLSISILWEILTPFFVYFFFFWIFMMMKVDHDNARRVCVT